MERARRRRCLRTLTLAAAGAAALSAAGASAMAATGHPVSPAAGACAKASGPTRVGHFSGIIRPVAVKNACPRIRAGDPAKGTPPLLFHGGNVMGTSSTGAVVITPIFWDPTGFGMATAYKNIITTYLSGVAAASGQHTNVFSTLTEYSGANGSILYKVKMGTAINDTDALPASGCTVGSKDKTGIYADNTGYKACLDDAQIRTEANKVRKAHKLPANLAHIYVVFLPKHVEACFHSGSTTTSANQCAINHYPSATFCAYHSLATSSHVVYANMAFPVYKSPTGFTCGSDGSFGVVETPNGNADADTEVSPTSHEIMEAITDPDTQTGWYDSSGFENGDECAYVYGTTQGTAGSRYNQVIGGHHYLTQEEFSNNDYASTGGGCLPSE